MDEKERIQTFYEELKKQEDMPFIMADVGYYLFAVLGCMFLWFPCSVLTRFFLEPMIGGFLCLGTALYIRILPYHRIRVKNRAIPISTYLKFYPVDPKVQFLVLKQRVNHSAKRLCIAAFFCQQMSTLVFTHRLSLVNLIYPILLVGLADLLVLFSVRK